MIRGWAVISIMTVITGTATTPLLPRDRARLASREERGERLSFDPVARRDSNPRPPDSEVLFHS